MNTVLIAYHPQGWEIRLEIADRSDLTDAIRWLSDNHYRPAQGFLRTPEGLPICPKHGAVMSKREKQGDEWYSHNMGTKDHPLWCRGYKSDLSPGWEYG